MIAALVILIMWATITRVNVIAGKVIFDNFYQKGVVTSILANDGKMGKRVAKSKIRI